MTGASPLATGPSQAEPVVSALRASVPSASITEASWDIAFATFPESPDAFKAGVLAARIQGQFAALCDGMTRAEVHTYLDKVEIDDARGTLPEFGEWLPDAWDAYLRYLVGWEDKDNWARLPATFRWHEFHERLAQAIEARRAETGTGSVHESAVRQDALEGGVA